MGMPNGMDNQALQRTIYSNRSNFDFVPPPEAPVFRPTHEEFEDTLSYINKIRPIAEKTGICKIVPPEGWVPPFALDIDKFTFTPRIQKLNDLDGVTRLRRHFLEKISRFWELQGHPVKVGTHEGRKLDLFNLYHLVKMDGGPDACTKEKKWRRICLSLGYSQSISSMEFVKNNYEKYLQSFYEICSEERRPANYDSKTETIVIEDEVKPEINAIIIDASDFEDQANQSYELEEDDKCKRELKRLKCYGAGPKMPGSNVIPSINDSNLGKFRKRSKLEIDPLAVYYCAVCKKDNRDDELLVCNGCADTYHTFCLKPPLKQVPESDWRCLHCIGEEVKIRDYGFGFDQAERVYNLQEFGTKADAFKEEYFNMKSHHVPTTMVEKEFWRVVSSVEENVTVEYGADLHSMDHGSGFPTKASKQSQGEQEYIDSGWNLNNLPVLNGSVLRFINTDVSGMTVPWMYVGMCFSSFCWHNEDHWSYSINYLHWGEPKTWYGVPGNSAELLERTMRLATPELFQSMPDLLHQLVTIMNPNILQEAGVPIYRTDQNPYEFVVTFPRSYHAGFNQGYNFAEAVNFSPPDWLPIGRECVLHYKTLKRYCVFSHDELICKMALDSDSLDLAVVIPTYKELFSMVESETRLRGSLARQGINRAVRKAFEKLTDDERICNSCKTTCFLSSIVCDNCPNMVCLDHSTELCRCPLTSKVLQYRYNLDEMHVMLQSIKSRLQNFDKWMTESKMIIAMSMSYRGRNEKLVELVSEAEELKIPKCKLYVKLLNERKRIASTDVIEIDDD